MTGNAIRHGNKNWMRSLFTFLLGGTLLSSCGGGDIHDSSGLSSEAIKVEATLTQEKVQGLDNVLALEYSPSGGELWTAPPQEPLLILKAELSLPDVVEMPSVKLKSIHLSIQKSVQSKNVPNGRQEALSLEKDIAFVEIGARDFEFYFQSEPLGDLQEGDRILIDQLILELGSQELVSEPLEFSIREIAGIKAKVLGYFLEDALAQQTLQPTMSLQEVQALAGYTPLQSQSLTDDYTTDAGKVYSFVVASEDAKPIPDWKEGIVQAYLAQNVTASQPIGKTDGQGTGMYFTAGFSLTNSLQVHQLAQGEKREISFDTSHIQGVTLQIPQLQVISKQSILPLEVLGYFKGDAAVSQFQANQSLSQVKQTMRSMDTLEEDPYLPEENYYFLIAGSGGVSVPEWTGGVVLAHTETSYKARSISTPKQNRGKENRLDKGSIQNQGLYFDEGFALTPSVPMGGKGDLAQPQQLIFDTHAVEGISVSLENVAIPLLPKPTVTFRWLNGANKNPEYYLALPDGDFQAIQANIENSFLFSLIEEGRIPIRKTDDIKYAAVALAATINRKDWTLEFDADKILSITGSEHILYQPFGIKALPQETSDPAHSPFLFGHHIREDDANVGERANEDLILFRLSINPAHIAEDMIGQAPSWQWDKAKGSHPYFTEDILRNILKIQSPGNHDVQQFDMILPTEPSGQFQFLSPDDFTNWAGKTE